MKATLDKLKRVLLFLRALMPAPLPIGMTEFKNFADDIVLLSGLPDNDSMRFGIAAMIIHLGPTAAIKSKMYFILALRKGAANQIAGAVMEDIRNKEKAKQAATVPAPNA